MECDNCGTPRQDLKVAVINGEFGYYCSKCINGTKRMDSAGYANYSRDRDREDHTKELLQPRDYNGKPNPEFIKAYPEESQEMFTKEELENNC